MGRWFTEVRNGVMLLRQRILSGYGITLALTAVVLAWAVTHLVNLGDASDAILRENYKSILAAENMIDAIERQDSAILLVTLGYHDEGVAQFRENENHFLQWLGRAKDNITIDGEAEVLASIESRYSDYLVAFTRMRDLTDASPTNAGAFYHETVLPVFERIRDDAIRLRDVNHDTMFDASRRSQEVADTAIWSTATIGAAAVVLGFGFSLMLSKRLVRPIGDMIAAAGALAEGDYEVRVPTDDSDELSRLAGGFNAMAAKLGKYHRLNVERFAAEQRRSEAVLRSIEDGVVVVDADLRVVNLNPQAARILNVESESTTGMHFLEVLRSDRLFEWVKHTAESGKPPRIEEGKDILSVGSGDSARHYLFAITPVLAKTGGLLGVVLLLRDVTRLKEIDRLKSEFVMTASHELKTPLQSLGMSIELLKEQASGEPRR